MVEVMSQRRGDVMPASRRGFYCALQLARNENMVMSQLRVKGKPASRRGFYCPYNQQEMKQRVMTEVMSQLRVKGRQTSRRILLPLQQQGRKTKSFLSPHDQHMDTCFSLALVSSRVACL